MGFSKSPAKIRHSLLCLVVDRAKGDVAVGALEGFDDVSSGGCRSWGYC